MTPSALAKEINDFINSVSQDLESDAYYCFWSQLSKKWNEEQKLQTLEYRLVLNVLQMMFKPKNRNEPFGPIMTSSEGRTFLPQDLQEDQATFVFNLVREIQSPEIRARLYDCLWVAKKPKGKGIEVAQAAIENYLAAVEMFPPRQLWMYPADRLERALRIALQINQEEPFKKVSSKIYDLIQNTDEDETFLTDRLVQLALETKIYKDPDIDLVVCVNRCEQSAKKAFDSNNPHRGIDYLETAAMCYAALNDNVNSKRCQIEIAEAYVQKAENFAATSGSLGADIDIAKAIEIYRRIGGYQERMADIQKRLDYHNQKAISEMKRIETPPIDISEDVLKTRKHFQNLDKEEALKRYALLPLVPDFERETETARQQGAGFLHNLFDARIYSTAGRVVDIKPGTASSPEDALLYQTRWGIRLAIDIDYVTIRINPARLQIAMDHHILEEDFLPIVQYNPFVPLGRKILFIKGLYKGFIGELPEAIHLLLPQLENSMRHILKMNGGIDTYVDKDGIQRVKMLDDLLRDEKIESAFGKNIIEVLKTILTAKDGPNLRHEMAHGMMDYSDCHSNSAMYFCWLMLSLCYLGYLMHPRHKKDAETATQPD
jgi:hypothetical protein